MIWSVQPQRMFLSRVFCEFPVAKRMIYHSLPNAREKVLCIKLSILQEIEESRRQTSVGSKFIYSNFGFDIMCKEVKKR